MENQIAPIDQLFKHSLPRLMQAAAEYRTLAIPLCPGDQGQVLGEIQRRINQTDFLLRNLVQLVGQQVASSCDVFAAAASQQPDADQRFEASCRQLDAIWLLTETFYWVSHKTRDVVTAKGLDKSKRLPGMPSVKEMRHTAVINVRNHLIEHPHEHRESFSLGGWKGPVLAGGLGKDEKGNVIQDPGLLINAVEWVDALADVLTQAAAKIKSISA